MVQVKLAIVLLPSRLGYSISYRQLCPSASPQLLSRPCRRSPRSARDFVAYNLTVPALRAIFAAPMPLIEIAGFHPRNDMPYRALLFKRREDALKLPVLLLESREHELLLSMGPCKTFQTVNSAAPAVIKKDTISCAAELNLQIFKWRLPM